MSGRDHGRAMFDSLRGFQTDDALAKDWPGIEVRDDGVWVTLPDDRNCFVGEGEISALLEQHPSRDPYTPALRFPFNLEDLIDFEDACNLFAGLYRPWDEEAFSKKVALLRKRSEAAAVLIDGLFGDSPRRRGRRTMPVSKQHRDAVLKAITALGMVASDLPSKPPGNSLGPKGLTWAYLQQSRDDMTWSMFRHAWDELRSEEMIKGGLVSPKIG